MRPEEARIIGLVSQPEALARLVVRLEGEIERIREAACRYLDRDEVIFRESEGSMNSGEYVEKVKELEDAFRRSLS